MAFLLRYSFTFLFGKTVFFAVLLMALRVLHLIGKSSTTGAHLIRHSAIYGFSQTRSSCLSHTLANPTGFILIYENNCLSTLSQSCAVIMFLLSFFLRGGVFNMPLYFYWTQCLLSFDYCRFTKFLEQKCDRNQDTFNFLTFEIRPHLFFQLF